MRPNHTNLLRLGEIGHSLIAGNKAASHFLNKKKYFLSPQFYLKGVKSQTRLGKFSPELIDYMESFLTSYHLAIALKEGNCEFIESLQKLVQMLPLNS